MDMEHVERRRAYVQDVRKSFDAPKGGLEREQRQMAGESGDRFSFFKVRLILAVFIFAAFVLCDQTGTLFYNQSTKDIAQTIAENYDYSKIETYVMALTKESK